MVHLHKRFDSSQVKEFLNRYLKNEINRRYIQEILGISKTRFFAILKKYKADQNNFSITCTRKNPSRKISPDIEKNIVKELSIEQELIKDKDIPLKNYNYSYIKDYLLKEYNQKVSVHTIIRRAKTHGFHLGKRKRKIHDREVLTQYAGELIQHDSSYHLWAPCAKEKWSLITS